MICDNSFLLLEKKFKFEEDFCRSPLLRVKLSVKFLMSLMEPLYDRLCPKWGRLKLLLIDKSSLKIGGCSKALFLWKFCRDFFEYSKGSPPSGGSFSSFFWLEVRPQFEGRKSVSAFNFEEIIVRLFLQLTVKMDSFSSSITLRMCA